MRRFAGPMSARITAVGEAGVWLGDWTPHPAPNPSALELLPKMPGNHCASNVLRSPPSENKKRLSPPSFQVGTQSLAGRNPIQEATVGFEPTNEIGRAHV